MAESDVDVEMQMKGLVHTRLSRLMHKIEAGQWSWEDVEGEAHNTLDMTVQLNQVCDVEDVVNCVSEALRLLSKTSGQGTDGREAHLSPASKQPYVGRPRYEIPSEFLLFMISSGFTIPAIAELIGVSVSTVKRRLRDDHITVSALYTAISDEKLQEGVRNIVLQFPGVGYRTVKSHLLAQNIRVPEHRVRDAVRTVDPEGVLLRRLSLTITHRRRYSVRAPLALWHIDGYHKLIRWNIVVHGGIDGYSRLPVFLKASNNNRSETVLQGFQEAVQEYGLPEKVRSDKGGENVLVAQYMMERRGTEQCFITGRSVHNQRIERLWRDLWQGCIILFYQLFVHMETVGILDRDQDSDLLALHYIYIPRIQEHLQQFKQAFTHRPLRTEGNKSPWQLWIEGQLLDPQLNYDDNINPEWYGVDWSQPSCAGDNPCIAVEVPQLALPPGAKDRLLHSVDPLGQSATHGMDLYENARVVLTDCIANR